MNYDLVFFILYTQQQNPALIFGIPLPISAGHLLGNCVYTYILVDAMWCSVSGMKNILILDNKASN